MHGRGKFNDATKSSTITTCCEDRPVDLPPSKTNPELAESHSGKDAGKRLGKKAKMSIGKMVTYEYCTPLTTGCYGKRAGDVI